MRRRITRWALGGAVLGLLSATLVAPWAGAQSSGTLFIRAIDATDAQRTNIDYVATGGDGASAQIAVNTYQRGAEAITTVADANPKPEMGVSLVVDTGPNMANTNALVSLKDASKEFVRATTAKGMSVAIYQAGDRANLVQSFTADVTKLTNAIDRLTPSKSAAVWGALRLAGGGYGEANRVQPNIVLAVGDDDTVNPVDQPAASGAVLGSGATVFALEYAGGGMDPTPIDSLVQRTGGTIQSTTDPGQMPTMLSNVQDILINKQFRAVVNSGLKQGDIADITVTVGSQTAEASIVIGASAQGARQLNPEVVSGGGPLAFLSNWMGLVIGLILFLAATAFFIYAMVLLFMPDNTLSHVLQPYDGFAADDAAEEDGGSPALAKGALLQRAVELTEQVAESQGYLSRAEAALERANLPLRAGEALFFYVALVLVALLVLLAMSRNPFIGLVGGLVVAMIPPSVINFLASRRRRTFMNQLPDTLQLLSGTLRAGYSLMQGVEAVSQEVTDPMGVELRRVVTESRLGRPLEESLESAAERMDSPDFAWAVMAIRIQREVGGNLSELLLTVAETMTARERLRRDVRTLTAEGRMSAIVLGILPIGLGAVMFVINPEYMGQLYKTTLGIIFTVVAAVAMGIGFFWMKKIIDIEI